MIRLTDDAEPELTIEKAEFQRQVTNNMFWGLPTKHFEIERDVVKLSSDVASKLVWNLDEEMKDELNVNARTQTVTIDGDKYQINSGSFCAYVSKEDVRRESSL